jgi:hypothetical protein
MKLPHISQYPWLMLMDSTPPSKNTVWKTGLNRNTRQSVAYKKPTLLKEINTGLG